ncbi:MAG: plasma-membrane proton-efflux P-type ATPase [Desulfurococcaceae archaeon]
MQAGSIGATSPELRGLTSKEVEERLRKFGPNKVEEKKESVLISFLKKFVGFTPITIEIAAVISFFLHRYIDMAVMVSLLLVNAIIGTVHEERASKAVELLKSKLRVNVKALRDGSWKVVPAEEIVPDDVIKLEIGDVVPADAKLVSGALMVDESALTGESLPVDKKAGDPVFAGTLVTRGIGIAVVTATGARTRFGRTVELVQVSKPRLIIENITGSITRWLLVVDAVFIAAVVLKLLVERADVIADVLPFSLTLLIASIPIALPAMTTITLALGAADLARKGVLVRRLESIEAASMMDVICLDKTGTITENRLVVKSVIPLREGYDERALLLYALAASEEVTADPIDNAINSKARELGLDRGNFKAIEFTPFSPETKRAEAVVEINGKRVKAIKGAPQVLAELDGSLDRRKLDEILEELAEEGQRALAVAVDEGSGPRVIGVLGIYDKPRDDSPKFISMIKEMGVRPIMLTGDNVHVARAVSKAVGIGDHVESVKEIEEEVGKAIDRLDAIAEVSPEHKYDVVVALQRSGHMVGMTGDGVNDAPALKKADLGVAVYNATDVAKSAAGVALTRPGLSNIVDLIWLGRVIYRRIVVWALNKIVKTFEIVYFVSLATILLGIPVVSPTHMILMLFMYDFVTLSISVDPLPPSKRPERWNVKKLVGISTLIGLSSVVLLFVNLHVALSVLGLSGRSLQTFVFYVLLLTGLLNLLNFREIGWFWNSRPSNVMLAAIIVDSIAATLMSLAGFIVSPIGPLDVAVGVAYSLVASLFVLGGVKIACFKAFGYA